MASCPPPGPLSPPTGVPTVDFLSGKLKMLITDLWNKQEGWNPSGKTRVYESTDAGKAITARIYKWSKGNFSNLANMPITEALKIDGTHTGSKNHLWVLEAGGIRVKKEPKPHETVDQYRARGGYLLYGPFLDGAIYIERLVPSWVGKHDPIDAFLLRVSAKQWTAANTVPPHTSRPRPDLIGKTYYVVQGTLDTPGRLDRAMDWVVHVVQKLCNKLTGEKMKQAAAVLSIGGAAFAATPAGAAALSAALVYQAIAASCGVAWPECPKPPEVATPPASMGPIAPAAPTFAAGSIAWFDPNFNIYRIATPNGSPSAPTHTEITQLAIKPNGVAAVSRTAWEHATKAWYARRTTQVSAGIGLFAVAAGGAALALRR